MRDIKKCPICNSNSIKLYLRSKDFSVSKEEFCIVKCSDCEFHFTNPRPEDNDLWKYYVSDHYISHNNANNSIFEKTYQIVRKFAVIRKYSLITRMIKRGSILDIGCGTGDFLSKCKRNKWDTMGIEPNDIARNKAIENHDLTVEKSTNLESFSRKFDIITMWHVLEHVTELNTTVAEFKRLLSNNGKVIIAVPNLKSFDCSYYKKYWAGYDLPIHLYHFTKNSITKLFKKHGFSLLKTKGMKFDSFYVSMLSEEHKTGKKNFFKSFIIGMMSNLYGIFTKRGFSSTIYIFEMEK